MTETPGIGAEGFDAAGGIVAGVSDEVGGTGVVVVAVIGDIGARAAGAEINDAGGVGGAGGSGIVWETTRRQGQILVRGPR